MGRPEIDPVFLTGVTILQMMERLPDRQAIRACQYDARWRLALGLSEDWEGIDPRTLVYSTHVLALVAHMSRLECVRETLRLAVNFLAAFGGSSAWEPWFTRYAARNPPDLRNASVTRLRATITETKLQLTYYYFAWSKADCSTCPLKDQCLSKKNSLPFRTLQVGEKHMIAQDRRNLCQTPEDQQRMHRRSGIEGTHSELARGYGMRRSRYRGLEKTDIQMQFTAAACNLRRWAVRLCWLTRQEAKKAA